MRSTFGVNHAATQNFKPVIALAEADLTALARTLDIHLIDGSVKGKKDGRNRIFTLGTSKKALQNSSSTHFSWPEIGGLVDHQPLDLMKHRRMGLVGIAAIGPAGQITRMGGFWASMVRTCTGEVWVRSSLRSPAHPG